MSEMPLVAESWGSFYRFSQTLFKVLFVVEIQMTEREAATPSRGKLQGCQRAFDLANEEGAGLEVRK